MDHTFRNVKVCSLGTAYSVTLRRTLTTARGANSGACRINSQVQAIFSPNCKISSIDFNTIKYLPSMAQALHTN